MSQNELMIFSPDNGDARPYPNHAEQWRKYHGATAWLYNPWSGKNRDPRDIGSDTFGHLIKEVEISSGVVTRPKKRCGECWAIICNDGHAVTFREEAQRKRHEVKIRWEEI